MNMNIISSYERMLGVPLRHLSEEEIKRRIGDPYLLGRAEGRDFRERERRMYERAEGVKAGLGKGMTYK